MNLYIVIQKGQEDSFYMHEKVWKYMYIMTKEILKPIIPKQFVNINLG